MLLILICAVAIHHNRASAHSLSVFSAGAATFHLVVSVVNFFFGLTINPLKGAMAHVNWHHGSVLKETLDATAKSIQVWNYACVCCPMVVGLALAYMRWP